MLRHYLLVTLRGLRQHRGFTLLNVVGLAVGIGCALVIGLYVRDELAYDRFHEHADRIARVTMDLPDGDLAVTPSIVAPLLTREVPEVEEAVRLFDVGAFQAVVVRHGERAFQEDHFHYADSTVFDVFTFPLLAGDPATALTRPNTVVLTETAARRYFGDESPLGQTLSMDEDTFEVTGVVADLPATSHLQFDFLASFATLSYAEREIWDSANFGTYVLLRDEAAFATVTAKVEALVARARAAEEVSRDYALQLEPLRTIHMDVDGARRYVVLFSAIAGLILLVACVNYMNLATARATQRGKEVGVRKVAGARRGHLVAQFYGEAALLTLVSVVLGAALAAGLLPVLRAATGAPLALRLGDPLVLLALVGVGVVVALAAGSYPALLLSSFRPAQVLKGQARSGRGAARFRQALVVFQFAVSVFLLVGTAVVYRQLGYMQTKDLGFAGAQVLALPAGDEATQAALPALERALAEQPGVLSTAAIDRLPGSQRGGYSLQADGLEMPEGEFFPITGVPAGPGVVETLGLELVAGRAFSAADGYEPDSGRYAYLVNEATLRATGWSPEDAVGRQISVSGDYRQGTLVGVFADYHYLSLHEEVGPMAFFLEPSNTTHLLVRIAPGDLPRTLAAVEATWQRLAPHRPFVYQFLDEAFAAAYATDRQLGRLFGAFALLAVLIACLGLFGLAAYAAERRTKEVGVRKVLGASARDIVLLLSKELAALVVVGALVAAPFAYVAMSRWLEGFAYRVELGPTPFMLAGGAALVLALVTVSSQALRAASTDPVKALRTE